MGSAFEGIGKAALKVGAILGAGMGIKDMIDKASAGELRMAQMDAVLKSTGGAAGMTKEELLKLADAQGKLTTYSKGANMETENLLLTFTSIGKDVFPDALKTVNDMSTALGQDTKSSAIQLGKALQDPIKGVTALQRVGVNFNEQQKEQIKTLVESGDTMGAQKLILAELSKEFGGSAEAAGKTFSGQLQIAKNQVSGMGSTIGTALLPALTQFTTFINDNMPVIKQTVTDAINMVVPKFKEWGDLIGQIATSIFPSFGNSTQDIKTKVTDLAKNGLNFVTDALTWMRDNIGLVRDGVIALTAVWVIQKGIVLGHNIALVAHNVAQAVKMAQDKIETAQIIALYIAQGVHNGIMAAGTVAQLALNAATSAFGVIMGVVTSPIFLVIAALAALGVGIYEIVKHWDVISAKTREVWNYIYNAVSGTVGNVKEAIINGLNSAVDWISSLPSRMYEYGVDMIQGLVNGIWNMIGSVGDAVSGIANKIKSFLHFSVPDEGPLVDYESWMPDMLNGLAKGIDNNKYKVTDAIKGLSTDMTIGVKTPVQQIVSPIVGNFNQSQNSQSKNNSGFTLHIDKFINNRKEDIEELAIELQQYMQIHNNATGGAH